VCILRNIRSPRTGQPAEAHYGPVDVVVPLRVSMGELDTEGYPKDCLPFLEREKAKGAPVEFKVYADATHSWDATELRQKSFSKRGVEGQTIVYHYNGEATEQSARDAFAFLARHLKTN
jgi:dienelactone hydrolase